MLQNYHHMTIHLKIIKRNTIVPSFSASCSFSKEAGIKGFASPKIKSSGINSGAAPCNRRDFRTGSSGIASSCFFFFVTRFGLLTSETIYNKRMKKQETEGMFNFSSNCCLFAKAAFLLSAAVSFFLKKESMF